jgi:hypothetical protein
MGTDDGAVGADRIALIGSLRCRINLGPVCRLPRFAPIIVVATLLV